MRGLVDAAMFNGPTHNPSDGECSQIVPDPDRRLGHENEQVNIGANIRWFKTPWRRAGIRWPHNLFGIQDVAAIRERPIARLLDGEKMAALSVFISDWHFHEDHRVPYTDGYAIANLSE